MLYKRTNVLCICNCLLGNRTVTEIIEQVLAQIENVHAEYIFIEPKDYVDYSAPKWRKFVGMTSETLYVIRQKIKDIDFSKYDLVLVQGFEIGWAVNNKVRDIPCIMFNDATPTASHELIYKCSYSSLLWKIRSLVLNGIYKIFFRNIFSNINKFFPRTNWCRQSLIRDFGIPSKKVAQGTAAIDLNKWEVIKKDGNNNKVKLLFIGNDFFRKGGEFLFNVYSKISNRSELTILSNNRILDSIKFSAGVSRYKNISHDKISKYFYEADIFVFPTYKEHFGLVQLEALASGLPIIARDTGGVSDAVIDTYNGYLMPYNSIEEDWVQKISYLIEHPEERKRMGNNSRKLAEVKYSIEEFKETIENAIEQLTKKNVLNKKINILSVCSCLLGNKTTSGIIRQVLDRIENVHAEYIFIEPKDYVDYPAPKWAKFVGMTPETLCVIRQKIKDIDFSKYDLVLVQSFEIGWVLNNKVRDIPCIMFSDATPVVSHELIYKYFYSSLLRKIGSLMSMGIYKVFFRNIFSNIDRFFPQTNWCGQSLIRDFGIPAEKVAQGTVAIDLNNWKIVEKDNKNDKVKLLFVGNDFKRKGGEILLNIYSKVSGQCDLTIISNDGILDSMVLPLGATHYKNISYAEIPKYFCDADIFIFPTYKEHTGSVQIEAMAAGLPIISRDIGGISEVVKNAYNGYLMPYNSNEDEWVEKINYLIEHPEERKRMGHNSRILTEERFNMGKFEKTICCAIEGLVGG